MRLLIVTQTVDKNNPLLGFFCNWLKSFAKKADSILVIALNVGEYELPPNVRVLSLGKEKEPSRSKWRRIKYALLFLKYIFTERRNYQEVFVHMNEEYILLGGFIWKIFKKNIFLWRNHKKGSFITRIAVFISHKVFYTSHSSFTAKFKKSVIMPVGVDTNLFRIKKSVSERGNKILSIGRIDPVKKIDTLSKILPILDMSLKDYWQINIVGNPSYGNESYFESFKKSLNHLVNNQKVIFLKAVKNEDAPNIYNENRFFINLTPAGSFDKTIIEAMACGCIVLTTNKDLWDVIEVEGRIDIDNEKMVAEKLLNCIKLPTISLVNTSLKYRDYVLKNHSLEILSDKLFSELANNIHKL